MKLYVSVSSCLNTKPCHFSRYAPNTFELSAASRNLVGWLVPCTPTGKLLCTPVPETKPDSAASGSDNAVATDANDSAGGGDGAGGDEAVPAPEPMSYTHWYYVALAKVNGSNILRSTKLILSDNCRNIEGITYPTEGPMANQAGVNNGQAGNRNQNEKLTWKMIKDDFVTLAFKRDTQERWQNGKLLYTDRCGGNQVRFLVRHGLASMTIPSTRCGHCKKVVDMQRHHILQTAPKHLTLSFKRTEYDIALKKAVKNNSPVVISPVLDIQRAPDALVSQNLPQFSFLNPSAGSKAASNLVCRYALYGVVMHSGSSASSGHYFCFARSTAGQALHLPDDPSAPWAKFNDQEVTRVDWTGIQEFRVRNPQAAVYMLLFVLLKQTDQDNANVDSAVAEVSENLLDSTELARDPSEGSDTNERVAKITADTAINQTVSNNGDNIGRNEDGADTLNTALTLFMQPDMHTGGDTKPPAPPTLLPKQHSLVEPGTTLSSLQKATHTSNTEMLISMQDEVSPSFLLCVKAFSTIDDSRVT